MGVYFYFLLTLLIEIPVIIFFYRKNWPHALMVAVLINCFTWPLLQLVLESVSSSWIPLLEIMIAVIEGFGYYIFLGKKYQTAFLASVLANGLSYGTGFFIN